MNTFELKEQVRRAIAADWAQFQQSHPRLAAFVDQDVLIESVTRQLLDDPDYQRALANAARMEHGGQALIGMIRGFVRETLRTIGW